MKRLVFKDWVAYLLITVMILALFVMGTDQTNFAEFLVVHFIALLVFLLNTFLLIVFGKKDMFDE